MVELGAEPVLAARVESEVRHLVVRAALGVLDHLGEALLLPIRTERRVAAQTQQQRQQRHGSGAHTRTCACERGTSRVLELTH